MKKNFVTEFENAIQDFERAPLFMKAYVFSRSNFRFVKDFVFMAEHGFRVRWQPKGKRRLQAHVVAEELFRKICGEIYAVNNEGQLKHPEKFMGNRWKTSHAELMRITAASPDQVRLALEKVKGSGVIIVDAPWDGVTRKLFMRPNHDRILEVMNQLLVLETGLQQKNDGQGGGEDDGAKQEPVGGGDHLESKRAAPGETQDAGDENNPVSTASETEELSRASGSSGKKPLLRARPRLFLNNRIESPFQDLEEC